MRVFGDMKALKGDIKAAKLDRRGRLFALGQTGYRGASSEAGAKRSPRDKHGAS